MLKIPEGHNYRARGGAFIPFSTLAWNLEFPFQRRPQQLSSALASVITAPRPPYCARAPAGSEEPET